ncbi:MAG: 5-formyltetrahydrofolate cyclo-ligase [Gemmataceae bacterium]
MSAEALTPLQTLKKSIREKAHAARNAQADKDEVSKGICQRLIDSPEYQKAGVVMWYVDVRSEVRTRYSLPDALTHGKKIIVPYCVDGELELFHLEHMDELAVGMYRILEPKAELRTVAAKKPAVEELDLVVVPGVAFDRRGGRMGHGFGYYDKLLHKARKDTPLVALAFECQLFDELPTESHDIYMDRLITEQAVYPGKGRVPGGGRSGS